LRASSKASCMSLTSPVAFEILRAIAVNPRLSA
jgi:hypothetical protein